MYDRIGTRQVNFGPTASQHSAGRDGREEEEMATADISAGRPAGRSSVVSDGNCCQAVVTAPVSMRLRAIVTKRRNATIMTCVCRIAPFYPTTCLCWAIEHVENCPTPLPPLFPFPPLRAPSRRVCWLRSWKTCPSSPTHPPPPWKISVGTLRATADRRQYFNTSGVFDHSKSPKLLPLPPPTLDHPFVLNLHLRHASRQRRFPIYM